MDFFSHAFIPYILARLARVSERNSRLLGFGGVVPDFDSFIAFFPLLVPQAYVFWHRGITHSVIFSLLFSALLLFFFSRKALKRFMKRFVTLDFDFSFRSYSLVYAGSLFHLFMDFLTTGGIPLFYPFFKNRYAAHLFFYVDMILMMASLLVVLFFLFRKPGEKQRMMTLSALLSLFLLLCGVHFALKFSIPFPDASTYPSYSYGSWVVVEKGKESFTTFEYNTFTGESGKKYVFPYTDKNQIPELFRKAQTLIEIRAFMFHENAEVFARREGQAWILQFFDPVSRLMAEEAPPYMRHFQEGVVVKIHDDGEVELVESRKYL